MNTPGHSREEFVRGKIKRAEFRPALLRRWLPGNGRERPVQSNDDELVVVRLSGCADRAEWIVVIVEHYERDIVQRNHTLNRLERKCEDARRTSELVRIVDIHEVGDLPLYQEALIVALIKVDEKDLLKCRCCT